MKYENIILVNDSCVLFDLIDLNLINEFFQLDYSFFTTPQVIEEIEEESQHKIIESYIQSHTLMVDSQGTFNAIQELFDKYSGLSFTDCSILELSIRVKGIILSSDKKLRNIAISNNLSVKRLLWVIKHLVERKIITTDTAINKLEIYPKVNQRAPIIEIFGLIDHLKKI